MIIIEKLEDLIDNHSKIIGNATVIATFFSLTSMVHFSIASSTKFFKDIITSEEKSDMEEILVQEYLPSMIVGVGTGLYMFDKIIEEYISNPYLLAIPVVSNLLDIYYNYKEEKF